MFQQPSTFWHRESYDRFLLERLPELCGQRLPLVGYQANTAEVRTCSIEITLSSSTNGDIQVTYEGIPYPDEDGVLWIGGQPMVVIPLAAHADLATAKVQCIGEQLYEYIEARMGQALSELPWDAGMARAWLPLDAWIDEFLGGAAQPLDTTNWLSRHTHLRRIIVSEPQAVVHESQLGRVCPFECPEGPNLGRVFTVARGAEIRAGHLVIVDQDPASALGLSAAAIPFLEHNDPNRSLMGANMLRQWLPLSDPEPALVQTGCEPDAPDFWNGRNLLTAFVSWGVDTFADGIVISQSCARRLDALAPAEPGDKLSNRHGTKGVVSQVLPDEQMPHLPDGTPVELVFNFIGLQSRMNFGQSREALLGWVARVEGRPILAPPFQSPGADEIRQRLQAASLPEAGMLQLRDGVGGPPLPRPSAVGWVYWGKTAHLAARKVMLALEGERGQMQGELEHAVLLQLGAYHNLAEYLNTRAVRRQGADTLAAQAAAGPVEPAPAPTPLFADLQARLAAGGVEATLEGGRLVFRFNQPPGESLDLALPMPHPWIPEREIQAVGAYSDLESYQALAQANQRLQRMSSSKTPERLLAQAREQLAARLRAYFEDLLAPQHLRLAGRQLFSARAVIAPGPGLRLDQVGLPQEIAWGLFGPWAAHELGDAEAVAQRTRRAGQALQAVMARSWLIVNRAPSFAPTALLAFHPVLDPGRVVRLHPLVCEWLDADFDGDQVAVMLPLTEAAQHEAGRLLSVAAHLSRDAGLLPSLLPPAEALWGLAELSRTPEGLAEIQRLAGIEVSRASGLITRAELLLALEQLLEVEGVAPTLAALERLTRRGFEVVKASGASLSPFAGQGLLLPPKPASEDPPTWEAYLEAAREALLASEDYDDPHIGPQVLAVKARQRRLENLAWLVAARSVVRDASRQQVAIRHSYVEGLSAGEMYACIAGARQGLHQIWQRWEALDEEMRRAPRTPGANVLARALRSSYPGVVFARAAASGETDSLSDVEARLLVGLPAVDET